MLDFFRKYQRYFFLVITVVLIFSFVFFGTYSTFAGEPERKDQVVAQAIDGSSLMLSEVQKLSRFLSTDREDSLQGRGLAPNFCNDGVIRNDFLRTRLADVLVKEYFDVLKGDFEARLDKAKRYRPYAHPDAPFLSAQAIWNHFVPALNAELTALQAEEKATPAVFSHLSRLYQYQSHLQPEMLRRILIHQHKQYPWLTIDQRLSYEDFSLFGFHSVSDWFGRDFVDLIAQFILNAAGVAEEKGYRVSLAEAKGDLIHHFEESVQKMAAAKLKPDLNFFHHLRLLGFDEKSASETWRKVLLFRRYFHDVGETAFVDRLPYRDFANFANETAVVQKYEWPVTLKTAADLTEFQFYLKAVCPPSKDILPTSFLSAEEVEKKFPSLVQTTYRAQVAEISKKQIALRPSLKQVWEWEMDEKNEGVLKKAFSSFPSAAPREAKFQALERLDPKLRAEIDAFAREKLVDQNPLWVEEALAAAPLIEKTWSVAGKEDPTLRKEGMFYRVEEVKVLEEKHILTFDQARGALAELASEKEGDYAKEKNPFFRASKEALMALQKNPVDSRWIQSGADRLLDQFKLQRKEQAIQRTSQEDWMKEQAFLMLPDIWSPIHIADDGEVTFFYLQEKKANPVPILDQLTYGKETLAADAKAYLAERLLQVVKKKNAIAIPVQKEDE